MQRCIRGVFFLLLALAAALAWAQAVPWPTQGWQTATPESQGMDSPALQSLVGYGTYNQMDSLLVVRHGRIVLETQYGLFQDGDLHAINSATKSVLSTLAGMPRSVIDMQRSRDWTQFVLDRPMVREPGAAFDYNSGNTQLASAILLQATGMSAEQFAARELFAPLGITRWRWKKDAAGVSSGGFGLYLAPRDMAKFGLLALHHG